MDEVKRVTKKMFREIENNNNNKNHPITFIYAKMLI